jgi:hypothetical protein
MYCRATCDSSHCSFWSKNAFDSLRNSEWLVCIPDPACPKIGCGMKVAR